VVIRANEIEVSDPIVDFVGAVSVIVPARNEAAQVEAALRGLMLSQGVRLEIIAVNDRSTDETGRIMDSVAAADPRVRVIHLTELPDGWLGKNHAMHVGSQVASQELLLFTDGDILFEPAALRTAVGHFRRHRLQHMCLLPKMLPGGLLENVAVTFFGLAFTIGMQVWLIRTRWPLAYAGVGAFNLVDAEFYRSLGGHQLIRMDVLDDVKLAKLIKRNGGRTDFQRGESLISVRWQASLAGVITGLEKNGFASLNYSTTQIVWTTAMFVLFFVLPFVAPFVLPWEAASGFAATGILWHVLYAWLVWPLPDAWKLIPCFIAGPWIMAIAFWRSAIITWRQGGIRWRDSFYPLSQLRAGIY
jgi:glycosyltransferase involved in cell wall biosynthesis